jgi:dipeptidyl aminopeptidase/acylaminoacyl peptidase
MYDLESGELICMENDEGDSQTPVFLSAATPSKPPLAYTKSRGALNWIEIVDEKGTGITYQIGKGIHSEIKFTPDRKRMLTTFSSPSQPPDLWMIDLESGQCTQLTNSMPANLANAEFTTPEEIKYPGMDGVPVPALLFRPKRSPAPAVVMAHGGPNWHYSAEWNPVMAYLANRGVALLAPNYRGSTGYGHSWQYAARFDLGGVDTRDIAAGAQYLIREGIADPKRIAVTGRSHGGYLTMTCLTQYPELWCGGSAVVPFMNWFKSHEESRADLQHWNIENMGDPQENYKKWYDHSPYFFLERVRASVQLICGGNDPRCPASDSLDARDKLVELGKEVEFLLYEEEGHSFLKIENVIDSELRRVAFLRRVLEK